MKTILTQYLQTDKIVMDIFANVILIIVDFECMPVQQTRWL